MKAPFFAILVVVLLAIGSILLFSLVRERKDREKTRLSVRKMALSIRLNPEQEEQIVDLEINRKVRVHELQDSLKGNSTQLKVILSALTILHQEKIESILDFIQKIKYRKYRIALGRKKARSMNFFQSKKKRKPHSE